MFDAEIMEKAQTDRIVENFDKECVKNQINYLTDVSIDKDLVSGKKEEFNNKLSDSACGSLNESEDSGSKCQEYESNLDVDEESDSLECDDKDELDDSKEEEEEEEESVDNNTFNVINSENSESQEMSEITYDDSSRCDKIEDNEGKSPEGTRNFEEGSTDKSASTSEEPSSEAQDNIQEVSDLSKGEEEYDTSNDTFNEETSKKSEDQTETSDDHVIESDSTEHLTDKEKRDKEIQKEEEKKSEKPSKIPQMSTLQNTKVSNLSRSPKTKRKIGPSGSTPKTCDFKIEIFESKRKPDISTLCEEDKPKTDHANAKENSLQVNKIENQNSKIGNHAEKLDETPSPQNSDKFLSSEPSFSTTSEALSSESGDKTSSIILDVSQVIKEESEESDALSPIRSLVEDSHTPMQVSSGAKDTTRKQQPDSKPCKNSDSTSKTNSSISSNSNSITASPSTTTTTSSVNLKVTQPSPTQPSQPQPPNEVGNSDAAAPSPELRKPSPMAFTVDLDSVTSDSSVSANSAKKLDISASISQWAPKHKRNLSLTKVEEHKKVEERQSSEKPPLGRPRSGTVGSGPSGAKRGTAGYHSEGYFSSDQDDDRPNKADLKSPRSPRTPETVQAQPVLVRSNSQESSKGSSLRKFSNNKPEGRTCCKERDRKPSVSELTGKSYKSEKKMGIESKKQLKSPPVEDYDTSKDDKDDVSEAGTYTIDKDSPTPEEDQARNNIDGVFGITTESEAETTTTTAVPMSTTDQCPEDESSWLSASEIPPSISRNSPNWIQQWAAQVAEQTKPPLDSLSSIAKSSASSPRGHNLSLMSQDSNDTRPRRKLPTPPSHLAKTPSGLSPRSDPSPAKHRARVDKSKSGNQTFRNASLESHESGGDSDFDTCNSYPFNDDERMSASLKSKLRLTGLIPQTKTITSQSAGISPRRPDTGTSLESKIKSRDASYDMYSNRRDDRGLHSDSSSEASEPYKDITRISDNNPPLKFNRAFSLRRARLGCDESVSTSVEKKKVNRASSAGASSSARKGNLGASKSYQSVDNTSVSSPRSYGYGSPRGIASPSQNVGGSKGTPQSDNFDRTDGGRYSLRLPRSGSSSIGLSKSPSKSSIHKKEGSSNRKGATRSNSTLSSKEVDFQNWKRRKNYDPMKAAAEGRKKQVEKKLTKNAQTTAQISSDNRSPSPPGSLLRSASFHGTEGVMPNVRWTRKTNTTQPQYTSEDDGPYSLEEEVGPHPSPLHGSPLHRSPTSPHQLCQSPGRHPPLRGTRRPSLGLSDEGDTQYQSSLRKVSLEESGSEGKRSPLNPGARTGSGNSGTGTGRPKTKMEALDNLVISTIHSLSVKVRTTSESLLQKLKSQYDEEGDRAALLEEVLSHLSESDQSLASGQTRSTSRELAGILRNLKKIEHALEVIDKVIIVGEEDYRDDDVDYVPTEWVEESDY